MDGEQFLQSKGIYNHPRVQATSGPNEGQDYDVADLLDEFSKNQWLVAVRIGDIYHVERTYNRKQHAVAYLNKMRSEGTGFYILIRK